MAEAATKPATKEAAAPPPPVSTSTVSADVDVILTVVGSLQGAAIALDDLGVAADPASVVETGNNAALDPARPPVVDGADLLVFFNPALVSGTYSFRFTFTWVEDITPVVPNPLKDGKYDGIENGAAKKR